MDSMFRGYTEWFYEDQELMGGGGWCRTTALQLLSVTYVPHWNFQLGGHYLRWEEEKISGCMEGLGSMVKFWAY